MARKRKPAVPIRNAPTEPGFYWALWIKASAKTHEGRELTPAPDWDVVEVWQNHTGPENAWVQRAARKDYAKSNDVIAAPLQPIVIRFFVLRHRGH